MESEKVSVNVSGDKLATIDLLVEEGLVSNRSAFINEAIDMLLSKKQALVDKVLEHRQEHLSPNQWFIGLQSLSKEYLLKFKENGIKLSLKGFGSLYVNKDVDCDLILETVEFVAKSIRINATAEQKNAFNQINSRK